MIAIKKVLNFLLYAVLVLVSSACTLSPQTISIRPELDASGQAKVNSAKIWIEVKDLRKDNIVGFRGGVYDTDSISTNSQTIDSVYMEVKNAFSEMGFVVVDKDSAGTSRLTIEIEQLSYKATRKKIIWGTELFASIKATADTAQKINTVTLQDRRTKDYAKFPSIEQNEALINKLISSLLQRLIEDREFIGALHN